MKAKLLSKMLKPLFLCAALFFVAGSSLAEETFPMAGVVNEDNVNIRVDSTTGSAIICPVKKGLRLEAVSDNYDWYKVRLPKQAPAYVKKALTECVDFKNVEGLGNNGSAKTSRCVAARIANENVNIRLSPSESAPIIGRAEKDEAVGIVSESADWLRIAPIQNSFGWIHKMFISKAPVEEAKPAPQPKPKKKSRKEKKSGDR